MNGLPIQTGADNLWFCREHARDYNKNYNYFDGWRQRDIEKFTKDALIGHRATWRIGAGVEPDHHFAEALGKGDFNDPLGVFGGKQERPGRPKLPANARRALAILDLPETASLQEIKMRYKQLVKRHHPDVNGGDKQAEERFKRINEAHNQLLNCGFF